MGRYIILVNGNNPPPPSSGVCVCVCVCDGVEGRELDKVKNECHNRKQGLNQPIYSLRVRKR